MVKAASAQPQTIYRNQPNGLQDRFPSAAWQARIDETHSFAPRPHGRFAFVEELCLSSTVHYTT